MSDQTMVVGVVVVVVIIIVACKVGREVMLFDLSVCLSAALQENCCIDYHQIFYSVTQTNPIIFGGHRTGARIRLKSERSDERVMFWEGQ